MNARQRLDEYLDELRQRLQKAIAFRSGAVAALSVLLITLAAIVWLTPLGFPKAGVYTSRALVALAVLAAAGFWWWRQRALKINDGADVFEYRLPTQQGRIQTYLELQRQSQQGPASPLIDLLAGDALAKTRDTPPDAVMSSRHLNVALAIAVGAVVAIGAMLFAGNSQWGFGSRHLLLGTTLPIDVVPVKQVNLLPGNITVRRNADLNVQALVQGFKPREVELFVQFQTDETAGVVDAKNTPPSTEKSANEWERASMQVATDAPAKFGLTLYALRSPMKYYVVADGVRSADHMINVVDVPRIEKMQLTYHYPDWTGMPQRKEEEQRDIQAVAETQVAVAIKANAPLEDVALIVDSQATAMQSQGRNGDGSLTVAKPARYHIAAKVAGEMVALTDDYDISVLNDEAPTIEIVKPGRDWRASSIEEVPVTVRAQDDFKVQSAELRYAVNGGSWQTVKLPANAPQLQTKTQLSMEELGGKTPLAPGDLVTYYAVTHDRKQSAQTDLFMVQVQPFERRFTESQGGGGGGGGGGENNEQQEITERQKDLLVATWNLQRAREQQKRTPQQLQDSAQMLSDLQAKLAEQTKTLAARTRARAKIDSDARLKAFVESLEQAAGVMQPAVENLSKLELPKAIPGEQQALQLLLKAESAFRDIQVARQQSGGGGGGSRTSRDISELYELEMDLNKNQYETEKQLSQESAKQEVDELEAKLKELARRQEQLAQQRQQQQPQTNAERWKQEQLRREAEELRRQLQQLAQQQSQSGQNSSQGNSQGNGQSSGQSSGQNNNQSNETKAALSAVESALQAMRNADNNDPNNKNAQQAAEQASRNLQQAAQRMQRKGDDAGSTNSVDKLAEQARRLANEQRRLEVELYKASGEGNGQQRGNERSRGEDRLGQDRANELAESKAELMKGVQDLESDLREATATSRKSSPQAAKRLGEIAEELASSNVSSRLSRSIIDIQRGRGSQIAIGEGIITQALENAADDLRDAAKLASREGQQKANAAEPEALLAELAELRRALANAERDRAKGAQQERIAQLQQLQNGGNRQSQNSQPQNREGQNSQGQNSQGQNSQGQNSQSTNGQQGGQSPGASQNGGARGGGNAGGAYGGGGYEGGYRNGPIGPQLPIGADTLRLTNAIRQQLETIENRINAGNMSRDDIAALRAIEPQIHRLTEGARSLAVGQQAALAQQLDRLELAALNAAEKSRKKPSARAGASGSASTQESETVAEYYRRLGK